MTNNLITRRIRYMLLISILLSAFSVMKASTFPASVDSLQTLLKNDTDARQRAIIYIHLADIYVDSINIAPVYWDKALTEAAKAKDEYMMKLALDMLIQRYSPKDKEKVEKYISFARQNLPEEHNTLFRYYLYCYNIWAEMRKNNSLETIEQELNKLKSESRGPMTPEAQIQWEYLTGVSLDYSAILTHSYNDISKAIPYVERALTNLSVYPFQDKIHFETLCRYELADLYTSTEDKRAPDEIKKMIELHKQWNNLNTTFDRQFLDESHYYMAKYAQMIFMKDIISNEEIKKYYQKYIQLARKKKIINTTYETSARYYKTMGEYKKAIAYLDSAIVQGRFKPVNLVSIYSIKAGLYYELNDFKNAYLTLKESIKYQMSDKSQKKEEQMAEMQTRFDVNKLELEKSKLSNRNKQIALAATFALLLAVIGWSTYQRIMVKRLKKIHRELMIANEEVRKQSIKATESEKMKTAFLNSICHEIRTPLNAIVGFSHLIAESDDAEERKTYYNIVNANNERLLQLINEILDLSKIESGTIEFSFGPASLHNLCREVHDAHIFRTPQGVSLVYESSDESLMIETDKNRVFQVISNLIGNAVKFTKEGSISYGYKLADNQIVFHVTDTGTGIEPEKVGRVFERFAKLNNHAQGTGLGLSICKSIVERLGGKISVSSEFGKGTTFTFTLPYTIANPANVDSSKKENGEGNIAGIASAGKTADSSVDNSANTRHACILVAEDTDSNFDLLKAILGKDHQLIRAHDGMEAVTMFDEVKPDLILMDIKMPNLDGLEATKIIRELSATVPIIAQSAFAYEQDRKAAEEAGCNDFIAKPIADDKLKAMIHKWLLPS